MTSKVRNLKSISKTFEQKGTKATTQNFDQNKEKTFISLLKTLYSNGCVPCIIINIDLVIIINSHELTNFIFFYLEFITLSVGLSQRGIFCI